MGEPNSTECPNGQKGISNANLYPSSSAGGTSIITSISNEAHIILDGVALESTNSNVISVNNSDVSLTVGGYAIASGGSYAVSVNNGADDLIVNILASGHLFGGGILSASGRQTDIFFINAGNVYANDLGYDGSGGVDTIINSGFIGQSGFTTTINTSAGEDPLENSGTIQGNVALGDDDDIYTGTGFGTTTGTVLGGSGNDTLRGSEAGDSLDGDGTRDSDIYLIGTDSVTEGDFLL